MHEAKYYIKDFNGIKGRVKCRLCPHECVIELGKRGICKARKNVSGILYSEVYAKPVSIAIDPIEKKPLFHFFPGTSVLSFGTTGCNLRCKHCQNYEISQSLPKDFDFSSNDLVSPVKLIELAISNKCKSIAATYNEPTVFYEYMLDTFKIARKKGIKTVMISNGFINEEPLKKLLPFVDAFNIDLKSFNSSFYKEITGSRLENILETLKKIVRYNSNVKSNEEKTWLEITNLIIPSLNDSPREIEDMCKWIFENLGSDVPLHFSAFYPIYKLKNISPTNPEVILDAVKIARELGLNFVYSGNIVNFKGQDTICPKCKKVVIKRDRFKVSANYIVGGKCGFCGEEIFGVF